MNGEALVFLNPALATGAGNLRKNVLQLASKMRFLSAQYEVYLGEGLWKENAARSNALARRLEAAILSRGLSPAQAVQANGVFACLPTPVTESLLERWFFYVMDASRGLARWMCSWDNEESEIDAFAEDLGATLSLGRGK